MQNKKRKNKYPNNRFVKTDIQRSKKTSPHQRKEITKKQNRNGFIIERIPANKFHDRTSYQQRTQNKNFLTEMYLKNGYYHYLWMPFIILLIIVILDFAFQLTIYASLAPTAISAAKNNPIFLFFSIALFCINVGTIAFMGMATAKHNIKFNVSWYRVFRIVALIFLVESTLTIVAYLTFLSPHIQTTFVSQTLRFTYLIYLVAWNLIKSIVYMIIMSLSYFLFFRLKFI